VRLRELEQLADFHLSRRASRDALRGSFHAVSANVCVLEMLEDAPYPRPTLQKLGSALGSGPGPPFWMNFRSAARGAEGDGGVRVERFILKNVVREAKERSSSSSNSRGAP
jgi:hypothetical protein